MAKVGAPYLPIRPAGHKPAPVPYFHELMKAQNMLPVGITALAASTGGEDEADIVEEGEVDPTDVKDVTQDEEFEEKTGYKNIEEWLVDKGKNPDDYDEVEKSQLKKDILAQLDSIKKIRERTVESQKIMQSYLDNLEEKHQGGLVGINKLTRGLQWQ